MYAKRIDGRGFEETRKIEAKVGIIPRADGSASFKIGNTIAYAAVYGPKNLFPRFLQNPEKGILRVHYNMLPFSGCGNRIRPGGNRRSNEISMVIQKALLPVIDLSAFPNAVVYIFIEFTQTEAGSRCAGICAASMALADAGLAMTDLVSAIAVGKVDDKLLVDVDYSEESEETAVDVPVAVLPNSDKITLLQMDGELTKDDLKNLIEMAKKACKPIYDIQKKALKEKYGVGKNV